MTIYTNTTHNAKAHVARDTDGEIMVVIEGPRGPVNVEIHSASEAVIESIIEEGDDEDLADACDTVISDVFIELERCFPGETFSHFADAPDDNSEIVTQQRTADEIQRARESIAYRDLLEGGLSESEIQALIS